MTLHPPKPRWKTPTMTERAPRRPPHEPKPWTFGTIFGEAIRKAQADKARRAELNEMGFRPLTEP